MSLGPSGPGLERAGEWGGKSLCLAGDARNYWGFRRSPTSELAHKLGLILGPAFHLVAKLRFYACLRG
jgi:hypothetical protein